MPGYFAAKAKAVISFKVMSNFVHNWAQKWAKERPRQYVLIWVTFWNFCTFSISSIAYGWNVWVDDLVEIFYGDVPYTMSRGGPVFAFSLMIFSICSTTTFISLARLQDPTMELSVFGWFTLRGGGSPRAWYITGIVGTTVSYVLMGVAVQYKQLWLLYMGAGCWGIFGACTQPVIRFVALLSFNAVGQKGVGTGLNSVMPGIWAASFSYWGVGLSDAMSIQTAIYIAAAISFALGLVAIPFTEVSVPELSKYRKRSQERLARLSDDSPKEIAKPVKLTAKQIVCTTQIWIMCVAFLFMMTPGFGIKYLIAPMIVNVYGASSSTQSLASFLFLFLYAMARFAGGALAHFVDAMILLRVITFLAVECSKIVFSYFYFNDQIIILKRLFYDSRRKFS